MNYATDDLIAFAKDKIELLEFSIKQTAYIDIREGLEKELELAKIALRVLELPTR